MAIDCYATQWTCSCGHALAVLGNEQDVADAYQSTFLQLAHVAHGRRPRNLKAYLFRTAANIAVSILRATAAQ